MFKLIAHDNNIKYLEIHNTKDGIKVFNAGTRYDWYVLQKTDKHNKTIIKDENGKEHQIDLHKWKFLPNYNFEIIEPLLTTNETHVSVIYSRNQYGTDKSWVNEKKNETFIYPLIHSTPKAGVRYYYTSTKTPVKNPIPMFDVAKVIFGDSGINNVVIDVEGKFGMTQHAIGIQIVSKEEGEKLSKILESDEFNDILKSLSFSNYQIDWRIFTYFKHDFYKYFLKETPKSPSPKLIKSPSPSPKSPSPKTHSPPPKSPSPKSPSKTLKKTPSPKKPTRKKPEKIKGVKIILEGGTKKNKNKIKKYTIKHKRK